MREIDNIGTELCVYQADLFELASVQNIPFAVFIKTFAKSDIAKRIDDVGFIFESRDINNAMEELKIKPSQKGEIYPTFVMSWIGYLLRYWAYTYETTTLDIYKKYNLNNLYGLYEPYHSLDLSEAVRRICESSANQNPTDVKLINRRNVV